MNRSMDTNLFSPLTKVTDDIYHLIVRYPFAMREMNSYLVRGEKGFTVIDTGSIAEQSIAIWKNVIDSGITIEKVVCTHAHPDHIGLAKWFQVNYKVPVYISELGYQQMQYIRSNKDSEWLNQLFKQHGGPELSNRNKEAAAYEFDPDGVFEIGEKVKIGNDLYETIWTPGHSHDHVCFYNGEQQVMILGDLVLPHVSPIVGSFTERDVNPLKDYFHSLEKINAYKVKISLPGHGALIEDLHERVDEIHSRHEHRLNQMIALVGNGAKTSYEVTRDIYGDVDRGKFFAPFLSTIGRLVYLESIGKLTSKMDEGIIYYSGR